jgi:hypothetical protein
MAKRKRKTNAITNKRRLKDGRGSGYLGSYKPWIHIQDIASKGLATRIKGIKTGRVHHLLSKLELDCFYCLDWAEQVLDIREQYPLYLAETLASAKELNIRHPRVPVTGEEVVMTTDFLVTMRHPLGFKEVAICVKYAHDLENSRSVEKLEIERVYWNRRGVKWLIITERQINPVLVKNIRWIHSFADIEYSQPNITPIIIENTANFMYEFICRENVPLRNATDSSDKNFSLETGTSLAIVRHLIAAKRWLVNMQKPLQPEKSLPILNLHLEEVFE